MKNYEDLVELLKKVQATGGLDCDQASVCNYQDMIGHSTADQLRELANGVYSGAFYRVYGISYGTLESIKFYMQNSDKVYNILLERDGLKCDLEEEKEKTEKAKKEAAKNADLMCKARDEWEKEKTEKEKAQKELEKAQAEIIELKAKLYDLITK